MSDLSTIAHAVRMFSEGAPLDDIRQLPGMAHAFKTVAMFVLPSVIGLVFGIATWRETPLAKKLGFKGDGHNSDWVKRACEFDRTAKPMVIR